MTDTQSAEIFRSLVHTSTSAKFLSYRRRRRERRQERWPGGGSIFRSQPPRGQPAVSLVPAGRRSGAFSPYLPPAQNQQLERSIQTLILFSSQRIQFDSNTILVSGRPTHQLRFNHDAQGDAPRRRGQEDAVGRQGRSFSHEQFRVDGQVYAADLLAHREFYALEYKNAAHLVCDGFVWP